MRKRPGLIATATACKIVGVARRTWYRMVKDGKIQGFVFDGGEHKKMFYRREDVERLKRT